MLPYAGPPMGEKWHEFSDTYHMHALLGVHQYILFSGDFKWLLTIWDLYVRALEYTLAFTDPNTGLLMVTHVGDWLRPGMGGENIEAQGILHKTLTTSIALSSWLKARKYKYKNYDAHQKRWKYHRQLLRDNIQTPKKLWNAKAGLFCDNPFTRRHVFPQDGNSIAIYSRMVRPGSAQLTTISDALAARWGPFGAPATEAPGVISPFATGFELHAHALAGRIDRVLALTRRQWGYMLDGPGFTNSTLAEGYRVDGDHGYPLYRRRNRNSHAHGWSAAPTSVLIEYVLGIRLTGPLGETWVVEPQIADLDWVQGGFLTRLGRFEVEMRRANGVLVIRVTTPEGSSGVVSIEGRRWKLAGGEWVWKVNEGQRPTGIPKVRSVAPEDEDFVIGRVSSEL